MPIHRDNRGFSFLEFTIVVCLVVFLGIIALNRFTAVLVEAERVVLDQTVSTMQSMAGTVVAEHMARGKVDEIVKFHHTNPMDLLAKKPVNYLGEFKSLNPKEVAPGSWYYDKQKKVLIYRVKFEEYFRSKARDGVSAQFRLRLLYRDNNEDRRYDPQEDDLQGLKLETLHHYQWLNER